MATFILSLRARGVSDLALLRAMELVPREMFAPRRFADLARADVALPLACGQTMTSPAGVAAMLALLEVKPGRRVLEIGTGSGYVTALLATMGADVVSVECRPILAEGAESRLRLAGLRDAIDLRCADALGEMAAGGGRFDRILVNGALPAVPAALTSLLPAGGRLACGFAGERPGASPRLAVMAREEDGRIVQALLGPVRLSPLLSGDDLNAFRGSRNGALT